MTSANALRRQQDLTKLIGKYRYRYLNQSTSGLSESSTRIIVNHLLTDLLGYKELKEIKNEFYINGVYVDYLIEVNNKKIFAVEVKPIGTQFTNKHLNQALLYAAIIGTDWLILTNARTLRLYRILYRKPIKSVKLLDIKLNNSSYETAKLMDYLTRRSVVHGDLENLWLSGVKTD
jgi:hypothetical protein